MHRLVAAGFVATLAASTGCTSPAPGPSDALGAAAAGAELRGYIEDVAGADGRVYGAHDDHGHTMDTAKIIAIPETGGFAAVFHSWRDDPGAFDVHLATSSDLLTWTWQVRLTTEASQPTIRVAQDGGFVTAWERTRIVGDPSPPAFAYYPTWAALLAAEPTKTYEARLSLSPCCEGTPNLYSASSKAADVGIHFYDDYIRDRQARGTMTWTDFPVTRQPQLDATVTSIGVEGHIGDRDAIQFRGFDFLLLEGQLRPNDNGAWRLFLVDELTGTAQPLDIRTPQGKISMSNPTLELVELGGRAALVIGVFVHQGTDAESGQLIYYRTLRDG